jgi:hypothetical protein
MSRDYWVKTYVSQLHDKVKRLKGNDVIHSWGKVPTLPNAEARSCQMINWV